jgi:hypothetical protein
MRWSWISGLNNLKKAIVACLMVLSWHFCGKTEENDRTFSEYSQIADNLAEILLDPKAVKHKFWYILLGIRGKIADELTVFLQRWVTNLMLNLQQ